MRPLAMRTAETVMKLFLMFLILGSAGLWGLAWGWGMLLTAPSATGAGALVAGLAIWGVLYVLAQAEYRRQGR
jgi:hypothetical protein